MKLTRGQLGAQGTLLFFVIGTALAIFFVSLLQHYQDRLLGTVLGGQQLELTESSDQLVEAVHQYTADLNLLASLPELKEIKNLVAIAEQHDSVAIERLKDYFSRFLQAYPDYDQIRLIDSQGSEQINIRRNANQIGIVPAIELQDKSQRYYVEEVLRHQQQKVYLSRIDLNREFGAVQQPYKPTLRMMRPIVGQASANNNKVAGLLVANLSTVNLLERFRVSLSNIWQADIFLLDQEGYFILHPDESIEWGADRGESTNRIQRFFPEVWSQLEVGQNIVKLAPVKHTSWTLKGYEQGGYFIAHTFELPNKASLAAVGSNGESGHVYRALMFLPETSLEPWSLAYHWVWWALLLTLVVLLCFSIGLSYTVVVQQKTLHRAEQKRLDLDAKIADMQTRQNSEEEVLSELRQLLRGLRNEAASLVGFAELTQASNADEMGQIKENSGIMARATQAMLVKLDKAQQKLAELSRRTD
ncbi:hypothetical protein OAM26_01770 [Porticoccaceae bacterium]|nr:hypothetical protein [Porticoccaceae bacterium]